MMMAEEAIDLPLDLSLLASSESDPATQLIEDHQFGSAQNFDAVRAFGHECDVVTFDHEVVNLDALAALEADGCVIAPSPRALRFATDKAFQRETFAQNHLPVPEFIVLSSLDHDAIEAFCAKRPVVVVKAARGGYDGRGVAVVHGDPTDLVSELLEHTPVVLEEFLDLTCEVAISVVTARDGSALAYPVVETVQRNGMCETVNVPSSLSPDQVAAATQLATKVASLVGAVGIVAIELFVTEKGIVINEVATRPHNSGHWSIEGAETSQFANHLRAVGGLPLGATSPRAPFITMINVVGAEHEPAWKELTALEGVHVHHYRKENRPGRKLGHVTILSDDESRHAQRVRDVRNVLGI
jgi:5-(carboxyamino)imidazole ribonucleotide synthase